MSGSKKSKCKVLILPGSCTSLALALLGHTENMAPEGWDFSTQLELTNTPLSSDMSLNFRPSQKEKNGSGVLSRISCQMGQDLLRKESYS